MTRRNYKRANGGQTLLKYFIILPRLKTFCDTGMTQLPIELPKQPYFVTISGDSEFRGKSLEARLGATGR
jgi:hypothetical protein